MVNKITSPVTPLGQIDKINEIIDALGSGRVAIDNETITLNASDELQTVAVIDQNAGGAVKTWTGTLAEYNAIATKDPNTLYNITDDGTAAAYEAYSKSEMDDLLYYKAGETFTFGPASGYTKVIVSDGFITNGQKTIAFNVPLPKSMKNITTVTCNTLRTNIRGNGSYIGYTSGYVVGGADVFGFATVGVNKATDNILAFEVILNTVSSVTNNISVSVEVNALTLTFS